MLGDRRIVVTGAARGLDRALAAREPVDAIVTARGAWHETP